MDRPSETTVTYVAGTPPAPVRNRSFPDSPAAVVCRVPPARKWLRIEGVSGMVVVRDNEDYDTSA